MGVYAGKFCWHEEWAGNKLAKVVQTEINKVNQQLNYVQSSTDDDVLSSTLHFRIWDTEEERYI